MIICITGMPGSGKSELGVMLKLRGFQEFEMRDIVTREMEKKGIEISNETLRNYAMDLRKKYGNDVVAKRLVKAIKASKHKNIVIAGVRSNDELNIFRKHLKDLYIIALTSPQKMRFERLTHRWKPDDMETFKEFLWREGKEKAYGVESAINAADFIVSNTGTLNDLSENLGRILKSIDAK